MRSWIVALYFLQDVLTDGMVMAGSNSVVRSGVLPHLSLSLTSPTGQRTQPLLFDDLDSVLRIRVVKGVFVQIEAPDVSLTVIGVRCLVSIELKSRL